MPVVESYFAISRELFSRRIDSELLNHSTDCGGGIPLLWHLTPYESPSCGLATDALTVT